METVADTAAAPVQTDAVTPVHQYKKALILFNEKAGSVSASDGEKLIEAVKAAGVEQFAILGPEKMSPQLFARSIDFDVMIVLGGDGTARSAAELMPRDGPPLILLPGGTLNVLPRALYGELAWPAALIAALERGVVRRLPAGKANGTPFFVGALFGSPAILARAREAVREGQFLKAWQGFRHYMKRSFSHRLRAGCDGKRLRKAEAVGVLCSAFTGQVGGDGLEWVRFDAKKTFDLARLSFKALSQSWRDDKSVEIGACTRGQIYSAGVIPATLDGEPRTFVSSVRITYDARGPRVLVLEDEKA
ncbi:MAG: diacylglycerol kinase family protein [Vitreimonas sp.]